MLSSYIQQELEEPVLPSELVSTSSQSSRTWQVSSKVLAACQQVWTRTYLHNTPAASDDMPKTPQVFVMVRTHAQGMCTVDNIEGIAQEIKAVLNCRDVKRTGLSGGDVKVVETEQITAKPGHADLLVFQALCV